MNRRRCGAGLVGCLLAGLLVACGGKAAPAAPQVGGGAELDTPLPAALWRMRFTDEHGHRIRLSSYRGKTIVLGDILTLCQEHCPIDTATFVHTAQQAPHRSDTVFLSITVDPQRDDPAQLAAYRRLYVGDGRVPQWHLLTGSAHDLARLWDALHVYVERVPQDAVVHNWRTGARLTYDVAHDDVVYFIDRTGRERYLLEGQPDLHGAQMPARMQRFMSAEGHDEHGGAWSAQDALQVLDWIDGGS